MPVIAEKGRFYYPVEISDQGGETHYTENIQFYPPSNLKSVVESLSTKPGDFVEYYKKEIFLEEEPELRVRYDDDGFPTKNEGYTSYHVQPFAEWLFNSARGLEVNLKIIKHLQETKSSEISIYKENIPKILDWNYITAFDSNFQRNLTKKLDKLDEYAQKLQDSSMFADSGLAKQKALKIAVTVGVIKFILQKHNNFQDPLSNLEVKLEISLKLQEARALLQQHRNPIIDKLKAVFTSIINFVFCIKDSKNTHSFFPNSEQKVKELQETIFFKPKT